MARNIGSAIGDLAETAAKHLERWGPILFILGLMEHKEGKFVPSPTITSHAKAKIFGIGKDDEAIETAVFAAMKMKNHEPEAKVILEWIETLVDYELSSLREWLSQKMDEFNTIPKDEIHSLGMLYAVEFFCLFAAFTNDHRKRKAVAKKLNIIPKKKPLLYKMVEKTKKIKGKKAIDFVVGEMNSCNRTMVKFFLE